MIRGAIFDADGVLLDSMLIWNDLGARYLKKRGIKPEPGLSEILFSMSMEQGAAYLKKTYNLPDSEEEVFKGIEDMLKDFYYNEVLIKPGITSLLKFLDEKKIPMALATSSPRGHITNALKRNDILEFFGDRLFFTSEIGLSKHKPDIYEKAAESLGTAKNETLVFEDSLYALTTAKNAGFIAIGVFDKYGEINQEGVIQISDLYLKDLSEFQVHFSELEA